MRIYRVHMTYDGGVSAGYEWFATKREANARAREYDADIAETSPDENPSEVQPVDVTVSKAGILSFARRYASHEANG